MDLLKLPDIVKQKVLNGEKIALKSGLSLDEMRAQKAKFVKVGLITEHQIQLNSDILVAGLKPREYGGVNVEQPINLLGTDLGNKLFFSRPVKTKIKKVSKGLVNKKNGALSRVSVQFNHYQVGGFLLIAVAALLALNLQAYIISLAGSIGFPNILQTIFGVLFLCFGVAVLPRLFQPLLGLKIASKTNKIDVFEQIELMLGNRRYVWESNDNCGEILVSTSKASMVSDELMYEWASSMSVSSSGAAAVDSIRDNLTQGTPLEIFQFLSKRFKSISQSKNKKTFDDWSNEPVSMVIDANENLVALIFENDSLAYQIVRPELQDKAELHCFCIMVLKRGLA